MVAGSLGDVEGTEDVGVEDLVEVLGRQLQGGLDDRDAGVGHDGRDGRSEVGLDLLKRLLDEGVIADVALVRLDLDVELLGDVGGRLLRLGVRVVEDGDVGTGSGGRLGHGQADTTVAASDDNGLAREINRDDHVER